jgi:hypothetical protein
MESHRKGELAQAKVELVALEKGYIVSRPAFVARYDLVIDDGEKLSRVQIKYGGGSAAHTDNSVVVSLNYTDRKGIDNAYKSSDVDALAVYVPRVDKVLWFTPEQFCGRMKLQIKVEGAKRLNSLWYEDYIW